MGWAGDVRACAPTPPIPPPPPNGDAAAGAPKAPPAGFPNAPPAGAAPNTEDCCCAGAPNGEAPAAGAPNAEGEAAAGAPNGDAAACAPKAPPAGFPNALDPPPKPPPPKPPENAMDSLLSQKVRNATRRNPRACAPEKMRIEAERVQGNPKAETSLKKKKKK